MKKLFVIIIVAIALLVLVAPGLVGFVAENQYRQVAANIEEAAPGYRLVVDDYQRGWFSSRARYHLELGPALVADILADESSDIDGLPTLSSEARILHGPLFFAGFFAGLFADNSEPGVSMLPALAHSIDSISVINTDGESTAIPGSVSTRLGLFGRHKNIVAFHGIETPFEESGHSGTIKWAGMNMTTVFSSALDDLDFNGELGAFSLDMPQQQLATGKLEINGRQYLTEYGFWAGDLAGTFGGLSIAAEDGQGMSMGNMSWNMNLIVVDGAADQDVRLAVEFVEVSGWRGGPINLNARIDGLDAAAMGEMVGVAQGMVAGGTSDQVDTLALMQTLLRRGAKLELDELSIATPDGVFFLRAHINIPDDTQGALAMMLAGLEATANLRIPIALTERFAGQNPDAHAQLQGLISAGLLQKKDGDLVMELALKGALLTINGQPMPLPGVF